MSIKESDRRKYNPNGDNEYTSPQEKPPRYDLRRKHKTLEDPLDKIDKKNEENDMKVSNESDELEIAKKVARRLITAKKAEEPLTREGLEGFKFKEKGIKSVATTYKNLAESFMLLSKANNAFISCKSSEISPDGSLGGRGYVLTIKDVRSLLSQTLNVLSELIDTFHDEVNSPYWKKTTVEDNPVVKEILDQADTYLEQAEEVEKKSSPAQGAPTLSDQEKEKIKAILQHKKW